MNCRIIIGFVVIRTCCGIRSVWSRRRWNEEMVLLVVLGLWRGELQGVTQHHGQLPLVTLDHSDGPSSNNHLDSRGNKWC